MIDDNIAIPETVARIGWEAFEDYTSLKSITIPRLVTENVPNFSLVASL